MFEMHKEVGRDRHSRFELFKGRMRNKYENRKITLYNDGTFYFSKGCEDELVKDGVSALLFWDAETRRIGIRILNYTHRFGFTISRSETGAVSFKARSFIDELGDKIETDVVFDYDAIYYDERREFISMEVSRGRKRVDRANNEEDEPAAKAGSGGQHRDVRVG